MMYKSDHPHGFEPVLNEFIALVLFIEGNRNFLFNRVNGLL